MFFRCFQIQWAHPPGFKFKPFVQSHCQTRFSCQKKRKKNSIVFNFLEFSMTKKESKTNEKVSSVFFFVFSAFDTIQLKIPPSIDNIPSTTSNENNTMAHHRFRLSLLAGPFESDYKIMLSSSLIKVLLKLFLSIKWAHSHRDRVAGREVLAMATGLYHVAQHELRKGKSFLNWFFIWLVGFWVLGSGAPSISCDNTIAKWSIFEHKSVCRR